MPRCHTLNAQAACKLCCGSIGRADAQLLVETQECEIAVQMSQPVCVARRARRDDERRRMRCLIHLQATHGNFASCATPTRARDARPPSRARRGARTYLGNGHPKPPMLKAAFEERCERLGAIVDRSSDSLSRHHAARTGRDAHAVKSLAGEVTQLRSHIEALSKELLPRLERLASKEAQYALPPRTMTTGLLSLQDNVVQPQILAATKLQRAWRRYRPPGLPRSVLSKVQYCPEGLRRNFVLGIRSPAARYVPEPVMPVTTPAPKSTPPAVSRDGHHFMSIL